MHSMASKTTSGPEFTKGKASAHPGRVTVSDGTLRARVGSSSASWTPVLLGLQNLGMWSHPPTSIDTSPDVAQATQLQRTAAHTLLHGLRRGHPAQLRGR